jgi:hypothetical protein
MHAIILGATLSLIGIETGWRPLPGGGVEYTVQINPREADILLREKGFSSDLPAHLRDVRVFQVKIGTGVLEQIDPPKQRASDTRPTEPFPFSSGTQGKSGKKPWLLGKPVGPPPDAAAEPQRSKRESQRAAGKEEKGLSVLDKESFFEKKPEGDKRGKGGKTAADEEPEPSGGSWWPLTLVLALLGSFGGNLYLGWITWETRNRYRTLLHRRSETEPEPFVDDFPQ